MIEAATGTVLSPDEFLDAIEKAYLDGLADLTEAPTITAHTASDTRIRQAAISRGYRRQPTPNRPLVAVGHHRLQPEAAAGWESLKTAAHQAGLDITIRSSYRSHASQRRVFHKHYRGTSTAALNGALRLVAPPGYSRHHTGYTLDIAEGRGDFNDFGSTASYRWLSADNFANAKAHGWVPSYPAGSRPTGPNPEPWEFVWIGVTNIVCAAHQPTAEDPFCDTLGSQFRKHVDWLHAEGITNGCGPNRFCGTAQLTRAQAATLLWRYFGEPTVETNILFRDVPADSYYFRSVQWMFSQGVTTGTSRTTFNPAQPISRGEFVTLLWRAASRPRPTSDERVFGDVKASSFAAEAISWAAESGITVLSTSDTASAGRDGALPLFLPETKTTRCTAAAFLHSFAAATSQANRAGSSTQSQSTTPQTHMGTTQTL